MDPESKVFLVSSVNFSFKWAKPFDATETALGVWNLKLPTVCINLPNELYLLAHHMMQNTLLSVQSSIMITVSKIQVVFLY